MSGAAALCVVLGLLLAWVLLKEPRKPQLTYPVGSGIVVSPITG